MNLKKTDAGLSIYSQIQQLLEDYQNPSLRLLQESYKGMFSNYNMEVQIT
jgi:hypothetical protein